MMSRSTMGLSIKQEAALLARGEGRTYKDIAAENGVHIGTVETHVRRAIGKLGAHTTEGALHRYRQQQEAVIKQPHMAAPGDTSAQD